MLVGRPDGVPLKYHNCYKKVVAEDRGVRLSQSQKQRLRKKQQAWERIFAEASVYMVERSAMSEARGRKTWAWYCKRKDLVVGKEEVTDAYGSGVGKSVEDMNTLMDLPFDPAKGVVVCVKGGDRPLFEVRPMPECEHVEENLM